MDEDIDYIFENVTVFNSSPTFLFVHDGFFIFFALLGIVADSLIVHVIASNRKMKTSANLILMNWSINDLLVLISSIMNTPLVLRMIAFPMHSRSAHCMLIDIDAALQITSNTFLFALISRTAFQNSMKVNLINITVYYAVMVGVLIVSIVSCYLNHYIMFLPLVAVMIFLALLVTMISKEVYMLCKWKTVTLNKEMRVRFNVARIYTYVWLASCICYIVVEPGMAINVVLRTVLQFVYVSAYLTSVYVIVYLANADRKFQICLLNLFRRQEDRYSVDATLGFSEDEDEEVDLEGATNVNENYDNNVNVPR